MLSNLVTQEFQISVTPVGEDEYLVRTEQVAPGVPLAEEQSPWPVDAWLNFARQLDPCQTDPTPDYRILGQQFYQALFRGTLRDSWMTAQAIAQHQRSQLRLRLGVRGPYLSRLPWEVLYAEGRPLVTSPELIFSRYQSLTGLGYPASTLRAARLEPGQPLRILLVIAVAREPSSEGDAFPSYLRQQVEQLQKELLSSQGSASFLEGRYTAGSGRPDRREAEDAVEGNVLEIQLTVLDQPSRTQLTQSLEQGNYQVLHYLGNSPAEAVGSPLGLRNPQTGLMELLRGDDLAGLLVNNGVRVAVFQFCRRAMTQTTTVIDPTRAHHIAALLIKQGVPGVLTLTEQVPQEISMGITRRFYRQLKQGLSIDLSVSRVRQELASTYGLQQGYWALPILYLHPGFDGYLMLPTARRVIADQSRLDLLGRSLPPSLPTEWVAPAETFASIGFAQLEEGYAELDSDDELLNLIDDLEYPEEPSYEEDVALVAGLLRQLSQTELSVSLELEDPILPASKDENLLPNIAEKEWIYTALPENPLYQNSANPPAPRLAAATPAKSLASSSAPESSIPHPAKQLPVSTPEIPWRQSLRDWTELWLVVATLGLTSVGVLILGLFSSSWFKPSSPAPQPSAIPSIRPAQRSPTQTISRLIFITSQLKNQDS